LSGKKENVKKLWDSIYKFYPLGSTLIWKTTFNCSKFREILSSHLLNEELLEWAKDEELPSDALDRFIEIRVNNIINILKNKLGNDIVFKIIDTGTEKNNNSEVVQ